MTWKSGRWLRQKPTFPKQFYGRLGTFRPAVFASDQRLATGREVAAARMKTKPFPAADRLRVPGPPPSRPANLSAPQV